MTASKKGGLSHHPAPQGHRMSPVRLGFILLTGPSAWIIQLGAGVAMTSWSCFPRDIRRTAPVGGYHLNALIILVICALLAFCSAFVAWRKYEEVRDEKGGGHEGLADIGHGRTRFLAFWGMILGSGFALATLVTLVAFALRLRCAG